MDLNQYLDRMSIKTTIIRIHLRWKEHLFKRDLEQNFKDIDQTDLQVGQ